MIRFESFCLRSFFCWRGFCFFSWSGFFRASRTRGLGFTDLMSGSDIVTNLYAPDSSLRYSLLRHCEVRQSLSVLIDRSPGKLIADLFHQSSCVGSLKNLFDFVFQGCRGERFDHISIDASFSGNHYLLALRLSRDHQHRHIAEHFVSTYRPE